MQVFMHFTLIRLSHTFMELRMQRVPFTVIFHVCLVYLALYPHETGGRPDRKSIRESGYCLTLHYKMHTELSLPHKRFFTVLILDIVFFLCSCLLSGLQTKMSSALNQIKRKEGGGRGEEKERRRQAPPAVIPLTLVKVKQLYCHCTMNCTMKSQG